MGNTINSKDLYNEWTKIGEKDYSAAKKMFDENWTQHEYLICYLSQQAAEKYLKAYHAYHGEEIIKIHILEKLLDICLKYDGDFEEIRDKCEYLTMFATQTRYPDITIDVNTTEAKRALESAETIISFIKNKMKDLK